MKKRKPIAEGSEWTFEHLEAYDREIARVAEGYRLDTYPNQIEIISAEQMMDAYSSTGFPSSSHCRLSRPDTRCKPSAEVGQIEPMPCLPRIPSSFRSL